MLKEIRISRRQALILIAAAVLTAAAVFGTAEMRGRKKPASGREVVFAVSVQPISAPVFIADARGYFRDEGLKVTLQPYTSGKDALEAVMRRAAGFATVTETPIMYAGLSGKKIYVIATIADSDTYAKIVARKDKGISGPEDLIGKKVGVSLGTNSEFFLHTYLTFHRMAGKKIRVIDVKPEQLPDALMKGEIDAAVAWNPYLTEIQMRLGDKAVTLFDKALYRVAWSIVAGQDFVREDPATVKGVLRALVKAENFIGEKPSESRAITAEYVKGGRITLADYNFDVRLSQTLLVVLDDQARWAIRNHYTDRTTVPNFLNLLYEEGLKEVEPHAVTVIYK